MFVLCNTNQIHFSLTIIFRIVCSATDTNNLDNRAVPGLPDLEGRCDVVDSWKDKYGRVDEGGGVMRLEAVVAGAGGGGGGIDAGTANAPECVVDCQRVDWNAGVALGRV